MKKRVSLLLFFALAFSGLSLAQGLGSIVGTVTDPSGAVLAGAKVTAVEIGTGLVRTTTADTQGYYVLNSLKPAQYAVSIESAGFRTSKQDVTLLADQALTVNGRLQLGAPTEVVEVTGSQVQVDTTTSTLKNVVEQTRLTELPLNGRNAATLTLTTAGSVQAPSSGADQGTTKTFPGAVTLSVNGTRQNTLSYSLDGGNYVDEYTNVNQPFPFPDALQEFSVQTSNYSAQYGQNAGAVVDVVTKSGTNNFHGNAFEFVRNPIFNAQNFFATPTTPDRVKRNQFGGTFGGPIRRDRTFFFGGYQRTFFRDLSLSSSRVVGQSDITNFLAKGPFGTPGVIDPAVATLLGINSTTGADLGANAKFHLAGPIPTGSNPTVPFSRPVTQNFDSAMGKVDHSIGDSDKITGRYEYDRFTQAGVFNPQQLVSYRDATFSITNQNYLAHETHTFSPRLLNDFRFSISHEVATRGPANAVDVSAFGVALPFQPKPSAIQGIGVQGGFSWGDNPRGIFDRFNFAFGNDVTWERGKHNLHFGGDIERSHVDLDNEFNQPGIFGFGTSDNYLFG